GAKVVHPRAAEIAMHHGIPLWVKNTFTDDEGTEIVSRDTFPGRRVTGVTHTGKLVYLQFDLTAVTQGDRVTLESRIYETMARYGINLFMLDLGPSSTGFAVPRSQYPVVENVLDGLVIPIVDGERSVYLFQIGQTASREVETQATLLEALGDVRRVPAQLTEGCTMVSLVGHEYMQQPGLFLRVLESLTESHITVLQTSDSDFSLSVLVPESDTDRAVKVLHDRFGLAEVR
ncbi:ACT domain-containing protein, partial [bacterium]